MIGDYIRFGEFVDSLEAAGVKYWSFCNVKNEVLIWVGSRFESGVREVLRDFDVVDVKDLGSTKLFRVKWV